MDEYSEAPQHAERLAHVMSPRQLLAVFFGLLTLTAITVVAARWDFGVWDIWVSMGIATMKAALVALYFMHLRYDKAFNAIVFLTAIACVGLFLALTLADVVEMNSSM